MTIDVTGSTPTGAGSTPPQTDGATSDPPPPADRRVRLAVTGMTCTACAARLERKLGKVPGVRASVNYATGTATLDAPPEVPDQRLLDTVAATGYGATVAAPGAVDQRSVADRRHAKSLLRRLLVALVLFFPVADLSLVVALVPGARFPGWQWVLLGLSLPIVTWVCVAVPPGGAEERRTADRHHGHPGIARGSGGGGVVAGHGVHHGPERAGAQRVLGRVDP